MGVFFSYTLTASVVILLLYPVMCQIVNRSASFQINRIIIILGIVISLIMAYLFDIYALSFTFDLSLGSLSIEEGEKFNSIDDNTINFTQKYNLLISFPWLSILILIYFTGAFVLLCREFISFLQLFIMIVRSKKTKNGKYKICRIEDESIAPFSWSKYIFLQDFEADSMDSTYIHERAHADKRHWIDVLFADLFCIILWYNPFAWKTRQLLRLNHEFEADAAVIRSGIDIYDYQRILITKAMGMREIPLSNNFAADKRSFRKRVLVMSRKTSSRKPLMIAIFAIPAIILSGVLVSMPAYMKFLSFISDYSINKEILTLIDHKQMPSIAKVTDIKIEKSGEDTDLFTIIPNPIEDQTALAEIIRHSLETIEYAKETKVNIEIVVDEDGNINDVLTRPDDVLIAIVVKQNLKGVKFEQILDNGRPIKAHFNIPIQIVK